VSDIDPVEFGRLQAQVAALLKSDEQKTQLLQQLAEDMTAVRLSLAEANGGWKLLMLLGGGAATLGSGITWIAQHFMGKTP
jgi:hypothetical protein